MVVKPSFMHVSFSETILDGYHQSAHHSQRHPEKRIGYMKPLDSFTENGARRLIGRRVVDVRGEKVGTLRRTWLDPSTYHVEFAGVRIGWLFPSTRVVPARDIKFDEENGLIRLEHPREFVSKAPHSNPKAELAQVVKEEIDAYYGCSVPLRRTSDIKEMRPEDALDTPGLAMATATTDELLLHGKANENRRLTLKAN